MGYVQSFPMQHTVIAAVDVPSIPYVFFSFCIPAPPAFCWWTQHPRGMVPLQFFTRDDSAYYIHLDEYFLLPNLT